MFSLEKEESLADRMKRYESKYCSIKLDKSLPIVARLDGKGFSKFTKSLKKPYDERLSKLMIETSIYLQKETNCNVAYTQSDEITLIWYNTNKNSEVYFNAKFFKMLGDLSAMCSVYFNYKLSEYIPEKVNSLPRFDCRLFNVPSIEEATNCLLWREKDAVKNSVSMAAQSVFSHNMLIGVNTVDKKEMLLEKGINWNEYPSYFKRGTYIKRYKELIPFTPEEIDKLPKMHQARRDPNMLIERNVTKVVDDFSLVGMDMEDKINFLMK